ncbi:MAG: GntR family transcriptional regulator, partial [Candidatus Granulicatella sp. P6S_S16_bin.50.1]|nr:GntR family transcriptional regulator [Candidatus Granulicatella sp. P6S_S16_bin.50.1]
GTRINEKEFSTELNISRTPIRYALNELTKEHLVEHIPKIGVIVKGISIKDAHEIYEIRKSLDTLATINAMKLMTKEDFKELNDILEECERLNNEDKVDEVLANFTTFNDFIYEKCQMTRLREIVFELRTYVIYFRDLSIRSSERRTKALEEHRLIYRGMLNNDVEQITLITHEHLDRSLQFILKQMEKLHID